LQRRLSGGGAQRPPALNFCFYLVVRATANYAAGYIRRQGNTPSTARYTIERESGSGGMATAYVAEDLKHNCKVAIKVFRPELSASLFAECFLRERVMALQPGG